jgi:hypothetical protein
MNAKKLGGFTPGFAGSDSTVSLPRNVRLGLSRTTTPATSLPPTLTGERAV